MRFANSKKQDFIYNLILSNQGITQTDIMKTMFDKGLLNQNKVMSARNNLSQMLISLKNKEKIYSKEHKDDTKGGIPMNKWYTK